MKLEDLKRNDVFYLKEGNPQWFGKRRMLMKDSSAEKGLPYIEVVPVNKQGDITGGGWVYDPQEEVEQVLGNAKQMWPRKYKDWIE